jgi:DNA-binding NarL/FixJ family response regulator
VLNADVIAAVACENADGIPAYVSEFQPDIVVLNASGFDFSSVLKYLRTSPQRTRVLACGLRNCGAEILEAIQAGAAACETIDGSLADLTAHVQALCDGETVCPPRIASMLFREVAAHSEAKLRNEEQQIRRLTRRERQIVSLVELGLSNKQIANELSISLQTVKNHVHNILEKFQLRRRAEAAQYARDHGLLIDRCPPWRSEARGG